MSIYTIGYQKLSHDAIRAVMRKIKSEHLVDVRSIPMSRRAGFNRNQLAAAFPKEYRWEGDRLGGIKPGKPGTTREGLDWLADFSIANNPLIMCVCHAPGTCHRHVMVASPLLKRNPKIDCIHIFEDQLILASELERSIREDDEYTYRSLVP